MYAIHVVVHMYMCTLTLNTFHTVNIILIIWYCGNVGID